MKTIIERGASWTLEETKLLLALWGQDLVQRQATNQKRTKEVYEKISEKFNQNGFERTADQVRTRVFNMIAEYRRILKDPNPERMKKCIFFEALHKIYQAKHMDDVKSALDDYEPEYPYSPASNTISSEKGDESISDSETALDGNDIIINNQSVIGGNNVNNNGNNSQSASSANTLDGKSYSATNDTNSEFITKHANSNETYSNNASDKSSSHSASNYIQNAAKKPKLESNAESLKLHPNSSEHVNSKQNKSSSGTVTANNTSLAYPSGLGASSSPSSSHKNQSLLLPHATNASSSTASTPISKLATSGTSTTPSYININSTKLPIIRTNQLIGHSSNGNDHMNGTATRLPTTAAITSHQLYQAPVNTFDVTSSALLIDRMFAHLSRESENMREWIALEKERLAIEKVRRVQEAERESRRERVLVDTLMKFQEQWISFLSRLDPRVMENNTEPLPEIKVVARDGSTTLAVSGDSSQKNQTTTQCSTSTTSNSADQPSSVSTSFSSTNTTSSSTSEGSK